jgi:hypothetical protein
MGRLNSENLDVEEDPTHLVRDPFREGVCLAIPATVLFSYLISWRSMLANRISLKQNIDKGLHSARVVGSSARQIDEPVATLSVSAQILMDGPTDLTSLRALRALQRGRGKPALMMTQGTKIPSPFNGLNSCLRGEPSSGNHGSFPVGITIDNILGRVAHEHYFSVPVVVVTGARGPTNTSKWIRQRAPRWADLAA